MTIEAIWEELAGIGIATQRRVNATHPHDLYADFEPPSHVGIVAVCIRRPPQFRAMRAIAVECGQREDGRWSLRLSLLQPALLPVFAALCRDIVMSTGAGVSDEALGTAVLARLQHWRSLLERDAPGLEEEVLRGLIGELTVLETHLLPLMMEAEAVAAWRGPSGAPQDFLLPSGDTIEVKTADRDAVKVRINGAGQLDPAVGLLLLAVVRLQRTSMAASGAVTAPILIARLRDRLIGDADALRAFDASLAKLGWHDHSAHDEVAVRVLHIDVYAVTADFPRLTNAGVPPGVEDVVYTVILPAKPTETWMVPL